MSTRRALHFVFKVGDRTKTAKFYKDVLGMKILRHEEFDEGCKASCNGPYAGKWSKTMVGYGPEDTHFVVELTYNYGLSDYVLGNDFLGITIKSSQAFSSANRTEPSFKDGNGGFASIEAPGGYVFNLIDEQPAENKDPVVKVTLASSDLKRSIGYWTKLVGMKLYASEVESCALLGFADNQCKLELREIGNVVDHGSAFGRIALSCPTSELSDIEQAVKDAGERILTPLVSLDTPGKATVSVVVLADPDGHEICFVGDEGFRELSRVDPNGDHLLTSAIESDHSDQWFAKKGLTKAKA